MKIRNLHGWQISYRIPRGRQWHTPRRVPVSHCGKEAIELQKKLAGRVRFIPLRKPPQLVAGLDCAFSKDGKRIIAAVVVLKLSDFEIIEAQSAVCKVSFPYIPGLLSFREAPACLKAVEKLKITPDLFIVDGQGIAHPRRLGIASHLGLFFDKPTVGCAKSRLTGAYKEPPPQKGSFVLLKDTQPPRSGSQSRERKRAVLDDTSHESRATSDETIGAVVRTRTNVKPVFVSVGHKCTLNDAIEITLVCVNRYRLPEPTRIAHQLVSRLKLEI